MYAATHRNEHPTQRNEPQQAAQCTHRERYRFAFVRRDERPLLLARQRANELPVLLREVALILFDIGQTSRMKRTKGPFSQLLKFSLGSRRKLDGFCAI